MRWQESSIFLLLFISLVNIPIATHSPGESISSNVFEIPEKADSTPSNSISIDAINDKTGNFTFEDGTTGNFIEWQVGTGDWPSNYTIYQNGENVSAGEIQTASEKSIIYTVDNINLGEHNFTIEVIIDTENTLIDSDWITKVESAPPELIDKSSDLTFEKNITGKEIYWIFFDYSPYNYTIYSNNNPILSNLIWGSNDIISVNLDSYDVGEYNFTLEIQDLINFTVYDSIIVSIKENAPPQLIDSSSTTIYDEETQNKTIYWQFEDTSPKNYSIKIDGKNVTQGLWNSSQEIIDFNIDYLSLGNYSFEILVYDQLGLNSTNTKNITITDVHDPVLTSTPGDVTFEFNEEGAQLTWVATDVRPDIYIVYGDGKIHQKANWTSGATITVSVDTSEVGFHNYTIIIFDDLKNNVSDTVFVTISKILTSDPTINLSTEVMVGEVDEIELIWTTTENESISGANVQILLMQEGIIVHESNPITDANGQITFSMDYSDVPFGNYVLFFNLTKTGYEYVVMQYNVKVTPLDYIINVEFDDTLVQGEQFTVQVQFSLNQSSLSYLQYIASDSVSWQEILVSFSLEYENMNGNVDSIPKNLPLDENGLVIFTITGTQTSNIKNLISFTLDISENNLLQGSTINYTGDVLPSVDIIGINNNIIVFMENHRILSFLIIVILLSLFGVLMYLSRNWIINYFEIKRFRRENSLLLDKLNQTSKINSIIIRNINGIPLYNNTFTQETMDATLISGLTSAITSFLDEFSMNMGSEFEFIEREDVYLLSHKENYSILTILSTEKISPTIFEDIREAHKEIDKLEIMQRNYSDRNKDDLDMQKIDQIFERNGIHLDLLGEVNINPELMHLVKESVQFNIRMEENALKLLTYCQNFGKDLNLNKIMAFSERSNLSQEEIARLIIELHEMSIVTNSN